MAAQSTVNVRMAAEPSARYKDFILQIKELRLATQDGKDTRTLKVDQSFTLPAQTGHDAPAELLKGQNIPPKEYRLVSIVLDPRTEKNSVTLASGLPRPLVVPDAVTVQLEGLPQGSKTSRTYDIRIVLDTDRSIQRTRVDGSEAQDRFTLRPSLRAVDASSTGSIKGKLTNGEGAPQKDVLVTAQIAQGGDEGVVRCTRTDALGNYSLDLLPGSRTYHLVTLPEFGPQGGIKAQIVKEQPLTTPAEVPVQGEAPLEPASASGTLRGTIHRTVNAAEHDEVEVLQELPLPGGKSTRRVVVHRLLPLLSADGAESSFEIKLPAGRYQVRPARVSVTAGRPASRNLDFQRLDCEVKPDETHSLDLR
jgi:hypothetical protein